MEVGAQNDQTLLEMFKTHEHFCKALLDAYAVVNSQGRVLKLNPLLSQMSGLTSKQILKLDSFANILQFKVGDRPLEFKQIIENQGPTRIDEVRASSSQGKELNCILGVY